MSFKVNTAPQKINPIEQVHMEKLFAPIRHKQIDVVCFTACNCAATRKWKWHYRMDKLFFF